MPTVQIEGKTIVKLSGGDWFALWWISICIIMCGYNIGMVAESIRDYECSSPHVNPDQQELKEAPDAL